MRGFLALLVLVGIFLGSCGSKEDEFVLSEREDDIHEIISTIVKKDRSYHNVRILSSIKKLHVLFEENEYLNEGDELSIPDYDLDSEVPADYIMSPENHIKILDKNDLTYLASQNKNPDSVILNKELFKEFNFIEFKELNVYFQRRDFSYPSFVYFTIPIFSRDNTVAYVQEGYHCGGTCGNGYIYILHKINGNWEIVDFWQTWIS